MKIELEIPERPEPNVPERKVGGTLDIINLDEVKAIRNAIQEHFLFIGFDGGNNIRNISLLAIGNCNKAQLDCKDVVRTALVSNSDRVVFVHNHPSKRLAPSKADLYLTSYINKLLKLFNITLEDHIIVTENDYRSMAKYKELSNEINDEKNNLIELTLLKEENSKLKEDLKQYKTKEKNKNKDYRF